MSEMPSGRMLYVCATPGCSEAGRGFCDEPTFCSVCMKDLAGVYDTSGVLKTDDEMSGRVAVAEEAPGNE